MDTRTTFGASGRRSPNWHDRQQWVPGPRRDAEFTLGLDDEWEDVPTAELELAPPNAATEDVPQAAIPAPSKAPVPRLVRQEAKSAPALKHTPVASVAPAAPSVRKETSATPVAPSIPRDITTGSLLCSRYLLGRMLGAGGSSLIFQAEDRRRIGADDFGNRIAIKVLRAEMRHNAHALTRLKREFRQMHRLSHPGVARVFELACDEDIWFMTMELIEGQTINQWLKAGPLRPDGLQVISACCEALAYAHDNGVVHGDLKPSNVLVLSTGGVKLVDFGSAAERDATTGEVDKERSFAATPPYASPQVLAGEIADPRDDVFSLACLTYAVLTNGEHPFDRKSSAEAQQAQMRPAYARAIHPRQFDVIVRALSWDREQRPASIRDFIHALLASDLRREPTSKDVVTASVDVVSRPVAPPTKAKVNTVAAEPVNNIAPSPAPQPITPQEPTPTLSVKPEDVARLKAAVAAAEAHAERVEKPLVETKVKGADPLERFRGYVAGPMAAQDDAETGANDQHAADEKSAAKKTRRIWPWQRSSAVVVAIIGLTALIATQLDIDAEPIRRAEARAILQKTAAPAASTVPALTAQPTPVEQTSAAPAEEKKSAQLAVNPVPVAARSEVTFSTRTLAVGAGQTMAALSVKRSSTRGRARVAWTIEGGTAQRGVHYQLATPQVIEFLDGQSVRSLFIPLTPEKDVENSRHSKTFTVKLRQASGGPSIGEIKQVYVTIVGDVADERMAAADNTTGS